jgi:adenylate cyclase
MAVLTPSVTVFSNMGTEIERRFLVGDVDEIRRRTPEKTKRIDQGYLAIEEEGGAQVRVRRIGDRTVLTVKRGSGESRLEEEIEIPAESFDALWPLTEGRRVFKDRYYVPARDGLTYEVDVYREPLAGLAVAEVEFSSQEQSHAFEPAEWLGPELTGDERYSNAGLAVHGLPTEQG